MREYLEAGKVTRTHGVGGELKVFPYCDSAGMLAGFRSFYLGPAGETPMKVESARAANGAALIKFAGLGSPEEARFLVGRLLYFSRADAKLAPGRYFLSDLIGASVEDADSGRLYGSIVNITSNGAQDIYHIRTPDGSERLLPAVPAFVLHTDAAAGLIKVRPIPGLLD